MAAPSRRQLAVYAADQLIKGVSATSIARHLAAELLASRRRDQLDMLLNDIAYQLESRGKLADVAVTGAYPLTSELRRQLESVLTGQLNVEVVNLRESTDNSLLGGLTIESATKRWDLSLKRKLTELRKVLN